MWRFRGWGRAILQNLVAAVLWSLGAAVYGAFAFWLARMTPVVTYYAPLSYLFALLLAMILALAVLNLSLSIVARVPSRPSPPSLPTAPDPAPSPDASPPPPPRLTAAERERVSSVILLFYDFLRDRFGEWLSSADELQRYVEIMRESGPRPLGAMAVRLADEAKPLVQEFDALTRKHARDLELAEIDLRPLRNLSSNMMMPLVETEAVLVRLPEEFRDHHLIVAQMNKTLDWVNTIRGFVNEALEALRKRRVDMKEGRL